jgi:hypothetical protein
MNLARNTIDLGWINNTPDTMPDLMITVEDAETVMKRRFPDDEEYDDDQGDDDDGAPVVFNMN